jgi:hypothetical protein
VLTISLDDSDQTICLDASNVRPHDQILEMSAGEAWLCRARRLCCARCDVVLGVRVDEAERVQTAEERGESAPLSRRLRTAPGVRAQNPPGSPVLQQAALVGTLVRVEQCYLGARYLRLLDAHTDMPVHAVMPLLCTGCGRALTFTDQLLCVKRRWGFNASPPERACYVNSLCEANIRRRADPFEEQLAQGRMDMDDVFCACGKQARRCPSARGHGPCAYIRNIAYARSTPLVPLHRLHHHEGHFSASRPARSALLRAGWPSHRPFPPAAGWVSLLPR